MDSSLAASRRAAEQHALAVAAGPPRTTRWTAPSATVSAVGAAVALPILRPAALALIALAVLLLAVHRQDRRNAWRHLPEPATRARLLPPLRPLATHPAVVVDLTEPAAPVAEEVSVPTQAVPSPSLPQPRTPVAGLRDGVLS